MRRVAFFGSNLSLARYPPGVDGNALERKPMISAPKSFRAFAISATVAFYLAPQLVPQVFLVGSNPMAYAKGGNGKGGGSGRGGDGQGKDGGNSSSNGKSGSTGRKGASKGKAGPSTSGAADTGFRVANGPLAALTSLFDLNMLEKRRATGLRNRTVARSTRAAGRSGSGRTREASISGRPHSAQPVNPRAVVATGLSEKDVEALAAKGLRVIARTSSGNAGVVKFALPRNVVSAEARRWIADVNSSAISDADTLYYPDQDPCQGAECALSLVSWAPAQACDAPTVIGMIDTGVDLDHEALKGQRIEVVDIAPSPSSAGPDHGTAIAGLLVGRPGTATPGLLPDAKLIAVNAFAVHDGEEAADVLRIVAALDVLRQRGVKIVNLSFSGPPNEVLKRAVDAALADGMSLVAAAGNGGPGAAPGYPAAYPGVLAVTAVDSGMQIYKRATRGDYIALAAPGVAITTAQAGGGITDRSGTSFAAPFVTAAVARLALRAGVSGNQAEAKLSSTARDLGAPGKDAVYGWGLMQASSLCEASETDVAGGTKPDELSLPRE